MKTTIKSLIAFTAFLIIAISCNKDDDGGSSGNNDAKEITNFAFTASESQTLEAKCTGHKPKHQYHSSNCILRNQHYRFGTCR